MLGGDLDRQTYDNEPPRELPGGSSRPSKRVDLERFGRILRRQELNVLFLRRSCGETDVAAPMLEESDLGLVVQMANENDPDGNPVVRKHAVDALGRFRDVEATEALWRIFSSESEVEAVRGQAALALARSTPSVTPALLHGYLQHASPMIRQYVAIALERVGNELSLSALGDALEREEDSGVRVRSIAAMNSIARRLNVRVREYPLPERPTEPLQPEQESPEDERTR